MNRFWRTLGIWGLLALGGTFWASCSRKAEKEALPSPRSLPIDTWPAGFFLTPLEIDVTKGDLMPQEMVAFLVDIDRETQQHEEREERYRKNHDGKSPKENHIHYLLPASSQGDLSFSFQAVLTKQEGNRRFYRVSVYRNGVPFVFDTIPYDGQENYHRTIFLGADWMLSLGSGNRLTNTAKGGAAQ
ncbi:MAG: hypothetical protein ACI4SG_08115 [Oligosphaeraceae bacterium]